MIQLALEAGIDTLLMDELSGRREAARRQLYVIGTIAILDKRSQSGIVDFHDALQRLEKTNFRLSAKIRDTFLRRNP